MDHWNRRFILESIIFVIYLRFPCRVVLCSAGGLVQQYTLAGLFNSSPPEKLPGAKRKVFFVYSHHCSGVYVKLQGYQYICI